MANYKGLIYYYDAIEYGLPITEKLEFVNNGYWIAYGNKKVSSYELVDKSIEEKIGLRFQFTKNRHNVFYIETVDRL